MNKQNKQRKIHFGLKGLIFIALGFIIMDTWTFLQTQNYWGVFVNGIFILIACYMVFIYEQRKLYLNQDLSFILIIFFIGLFIRAVWLHQILEGAVAGVMMIGFSVYLLNKFRKQPSIHLNKKTLDQYHRKDEY